MHSTTTASFNTATSSSAFSRTEAEVECAAEEELAWQCFQSGVIVDALERIQQQRESQIAQSQHQQTPFQSKLKLIHQLTKPTNSRNNPELILREEWRRAMEDALVSRAAKCKLFKCNSTPQTSGNQQEREARCHPPMAQLALWKQNLQQKYRGQLTHAATWIESNVCMRFI